jgi:hypothetical protein
MIDKLSDEEKAALESLDNKNGTESDWLSSQQEEKISKTQRRIQVQKLEIKLHILQFLV